MQQLPQILSVNCNFRPIHNFLPRKIERGPTATRDINYNLIGNNIVAERPERVPSTADLTSQLTVPPFNISALNVASTPNGVNSRTSPSQLGE